MGSIRPRVLLMVSMIAALGLAAACDDDGEREGDAPGECSDDADNDTDGLFDCDDPDCAGASACQGGDGDADADADGDGDGDGDADADECVPECTGRECGPDGCGGMCGSGCDTEGHEGCDDETGQCVCEYEECNDICCESGGVCHDTAGSCCMPDCRGRFCGLDVACGVLSCGSCDTLETCDEETGTCVCAYEECSGECCPEGEACVDGTCCTPDCTGQECGPDPLCGVDCGECGAPEICEGGTCVCEYLECSGACCSEGEACVAGTCVAGCSGEECPVGEWVTISAGTFEMGSPPEEEGHSVTESQHEVTLTHDFEILSTEVTQGDFESLMGYNPSGFSSRGVECSVEQVNWHETTAYCNELSDSAGLSRCYECTGSGTSVTCSPAAAYASPYDCPGYRLPTEAEWEYAARAGTTMATYNGDLDVTDCSMSTVLDPIAWYCGNSDETHPVGELAPNAWGLYDMLGNVWEWCHDWYENDLGSSAVTDPWGPSAGSYRVIRGGSWNNNARSMRAAYRFRASPGFRLYLIGFRPVRSRP